MAKRKLTAGAEYYLKLTHGGMFVPPSSQDKVALCVSYMADGKRTGHPIMWASTFGELKQYGSRLIELTKKKDDQKIAEELGIQGTEFAVWEQAIVPQSQHIIPQVVLDQRDSKRPKL